MLFLLVSMPEARALDTYNTYLWNRSNALAGNGQVDRGDWYEWWYFKVVDPSSREAFYFTYGVVNPWDTGAQLKGSKAMVQAGDFKTHHIAETSLPVGDFSARYDRTEVHVGRHTASDRHLRGDITGTDGHRLAWDLSLENDWNFNAMGWALRAPGSGIYWYPAQASARVSGWVISGGRKVEFKGAPAYQDRNWGRSFPKWWTWITSNHFAGAPGAALAIGGGEPPLFGDNYLWSGLCIGFRYRGKEYTFRSTDVGNKVNFDIKWGRWSVSAQNGRGEYIQIEAHAPPEKFMDLTFQTPRGPIFHDYEALLGDVRVRLLQWSAPRGKWVRLADVKSTEAGIEWGSPNPVPLPASFHFASEKPKNGAFNFNYLKPGGSMGFDSAALAD